MSDADEKVARYILEQFARDAETKPELHLAGCTTTTVVDADARDGQYGCDTGCDYYRLSAVITCSHDYRVEFDYGDFGEIGWILEDME